MASGIIGFDFQPRTRVVYGIHSVDRLGELASGLEARRALVVTDPGIVAAGHVERGCRALRGAGLEVVLFDRVRENPTTRDVDDCLAVARAARINCLIGLGGGSSIDTARGCNFLLTNGGRLHDYWGVGKATHAMLPLIAVPTTAGTGSECQSFALIADEDTHQKMACGDPKAAARIALLDPALTLSQPPRVAACTGIDALAHALETAVSRRRTELSMLYSREAFRLIAGSLERVLAHPDDLEARARMQLGAAYAGTAIENSMLGAAHSLANPLTARFGLAHGQAVGIMLPRVVRFNAADASAAESYRELAVTARLAAAETPPAEAAGILACRLEALLGAGGLAATLDECDVPRASVPALAAEASLQWTARFNPREVSVACFESLYEQAFAEPVSSHAHRSR